jgi:hypothetical protein
MNVHPISRSTVTQALARRQFAARPYTVYFRTKLGRGNIAQGGGWAAICRDIV